MSVSLKLAIDRIHMTIGVTGGDAYSFLIAQLYGLLDSSLNLLPNGTFKLSKEKYRKRLSFCPEKNRVTADLIVGVTKSKHQYLTLVLYPSKFSSGDFERIRFVLDTLFPDWSYEMLFAEAKISYIEIARDILNKHAASFLPYHPAARTSMFYKNKDGSNGAAYLGSVKSNKRYCVYDKAKQLIETQGKSKFTKRMRVEARLRKTGLTASQLADGLKNPFQGLELIEIQKLLSISSETDWVSFVEECCSSGTAHALKLCDKKLRKLYKFRLVSAKVGWWNPKQWWAQLPSALAVIQP